MFASLNLCLNLLKSFVSGGWGYAVSIGMALPIAFALGSLASFGLIFGEFIANMGGTTSSVTIIIGTYFSASSFAGLFTSTLFKKFSIRSVGVFGAILYLTGGFMCIFVNSVEHIIVAFGVLQGNDFTLLDIRRLNCQTFANHLC